MNNDIHELYLETSQLNFTSVVDKMWLVQIRTAQYSKCMMHLEYIQYIF